MAETNSKVARLRRTLIIIILAALPCYLLGAIVLWVGDAARNSRTPTPIISTVIVTATPQPSSTLIPPTAYPTRTVTDTATALPTYTASPIPTHTPLPTLTPVPTKTFTPTVPELPTETETQLPTATIAAETETPAALVTQ
jgi:hypothetical protein